MIYVIDAVWLVFMIYLSHSSGETTSRQSRQLHRITRINEQALRYLGHIACYFILGTLWSITVDRSWLLIVLGPVAVLDEATKVFVPGRHCSVAEIGLNIVSALAGVIVIEMMG